MAEEQRARVVAEIVGVVGLIGSLAFVGTEIRQNTTAVRSATIQAVADQTMELTLSMATDDQLPRLVYAMTVEGVTRADLEGDDYMRLNLAVVAGLRRQENLYLQVKSGVLPEESLRNVSFTFYRNAFVREHWSVNRGVYDQGFAEYWDGILSDP